MDLKAPDNSIFYDWITCYQDFDFQLPIVSENVYQRLNVETGEYGKIIQPRFKHDGSYCSTIAIAISGNRITMSGNPSKYNRLDNLQGLSTLDDCIKVFNSILLGLGLPPFTKCTRTFHRQGADGEKVLTFSDGCVFTRIDITSNKSTGSAYLTNSKGEQYLQSNTIDYIKGVSTLRYKNSIPDLESNGCTVSWKSSKGNAPLIYPCVYNKANELRLFALPKIRNKYGIDSLETKYIKDLIDYCELHGVARFEQKIKSEKLSRSNWRFYGLFNELELHDLHNEFRNIDSKLQVSSMDLETISDHLLSSNIVSSTLAANMTAMYAINWASGNKFDFTKTQVRTHRARLRKIGIDIKNEFDASRFSPVVIKQAREIETSNLILPDFYQHPQTNHLRLVA